MGLVGACWLTLIKQQNIPYAPFDFFAYPGQGQEIFGGKRLSFISGFVLFGFGFLISFFSG